MRPLTAATIKAGNRLLAISVLGLISLFAQADSFRFDIPAQPLPEALKVFAEQAKMQLLYRPDVVGNGTSSAVVGNFDKRTALELLLKGTGLEVVFSKGNAATVRPVEVAVRSSSAAVGSVGSQLRLADTEGQEKKKVEASTPLPPKSSDNGEDQSAKPQQGADTYSSPFDIPEVVVTGSRDRGYGSLMNTSGRLAKAYQDVPQMANMVTSELMQDMKRFDTLSSLSFVPGVNITIQTFQILNLRGFNSSSRFVDGFSVPTGLPFGTANDSAFYDRIEVVKGPAPGSFGRGDPGGFINYVTKDPTFRRSTSVDVMFGTGNAETNTQRYMIDTNGLLTEDGKTAYRVAAVHAEGANTPHFSEYAHDGALLSLKRNFTDRGSLSVKALATKDVTPGTSTLLFFVDKRFYDVWQTSLREQNFPVVQWPLFSDRNTLIAYDNSKSSNRSFSVNTTLNYELGKNWSTRQAVKFYQAKIDSDWLFNGNLRYAADGVTALNTPVRGLFLSSYRSAAYQSDFLGRYAIPAIDGALELLIGGDYSRATTQTANDFQFPDAQPLATWNPYVPLPGWSFNPDDRYYREVRKDWSIYAQVETRLLQERLRFTGSWRRNYTDLNGVNTPGGSTLANKTHSPLLPAYSVLYKVNDSLSVYALYSQYSEPPFSALLYSRVASSSPLANLRTTFQPKTELNEIGLKGNLFNSRLSFSVAAYEMKQHGAQKAINTSIADVSQSLDGNGIVGFSIASEDEAKGFEFECFGKITDKLTFMLNGNYVTSSNTRGVLTPIGQLSVITNKEMSSNPDTVAGYFTYSFTGNRARGLAVTAGLKTFFSGWQMGAGDTISSVPFPETNTVLDLGATYGVNERWQLYVKGNNVFESAYTPTSGVGVLYGRQFLAGVTAGF